MDEKARTTKGEIAEKKPDDLTRLGRFHLAGRASRLMAAGFMTSLEFLQVDLNSQQLLAKIAVRLQNDQLYSEPRQQSR